MITRAMRDEIKALLAQAAAEGRNVLAETEAKSLLRVLRIPVPAGEFVSTAAAAPMSVERVGAPVVVKAVSSAITHKTDLGGILFPIGTGEAAKRACETIAERVKLQRPDISLDGFLIEAYRPAQPEWIVALRVDPKFGPAIMFGLGGVFVDVMRQVNFRLAPLGEADIDDLLKEGPAARILSGTRGSAPADLAAVRCAIRTLSELTSYDEIIAAIAEIEINPLTISEHGVLALDALVVLRHQEAVP